MKLIISFSGRSNGNCDQIASFVSTQNDKVIHFRELNIHTCANCEYECFDSACKYRDDDIYPLYESMNNYDKVILIVPIYCGNPSSLFLSLMNGVRTIFCTMIPMIAYLENCT